MWSPQATRFLSAVLLPEALMVAMCLVYQGRVALSGPTGEMGGIVPSPRLMHSFCTQHRVVSYPALAAIDNMDRRSHTHTPSKCMVAPGTSLIAWPVM
jgi:hypothetical protein